MHPELANNKLHQDTKEKNLLTLRSAGCHDLRRGRSSIFRMSDFEVTVELQQLVLFGQS